MSDYKPYYDEHQVALCSHERCVQFDGTCCKLIGRPPDGVCIPWAIDAARDHQAMDRLRSHAVDAVGWNDKNTTCKGVRGPLWAAWKYGLDWIDTQGVDPDPAEAIMRAKESYEVEW